MTFNSVNQYCLDSIVEMSKTRSLEAADDICDEHGRKLWAKGNQVSADLREKLLRRKLSKPLEASLAVEGAVNFATIVTDCKSFLDEHPQFGRLLNRDALGLLAGMRNVPLPQPMRLLLTSTHVAGGHSYSHALATMLVCAGIAGRLGASELDAQHLLMAALLHDLGEMYVNPDYLRQAYRLEPQEWKHVASHPRIGQLLLQELTTLPRVVGDCIALHHERLDGSGYPSQVDSSKTHRLGGWLAVADSVGAILARGDDGAPLRAALALRIVPEEFDRDAVGTVIQALRKSDDSFGDSLDTDGLIAARTVREQLSSSIEIANSLETGSTDPFVVNTARGALQLLYNLDKSMRATGAVELEAFGAEAIDAEVLTEVTVIIREIGWRMRNLARNLQIRTEAHADATSLPELAPLIAAANGSDID